jgi:hypothetical protein
VNVMLIVQVPPLPATGVLVLQVVPLVAMAKSEALVPLITGAAVRFKFALPVFLIVTG